MTDRCVKHPFDPAVATCRDCGYAYCTDCVVYSFGPKKPPYCVQCALAAAGVRRGAAVNPVRAQKPRRLFGRKDRGPVVEVAKPTFDDIPITFPADMAPSPVMLEKQQAPVSEIAPDLTRPGTHEPAYEPEPALVGAERGDNLHDWAASLEDDQPSEFGSLSGYDSDAASNGFDSAAGDVTAAPWPRTSREAWSRDTVDNDWGGAAPWPGSDRGSFF